MMFIFFIYDGGVFYVKNSGNPESSPDLENTHNLEPIELRALGVSFDRERQSRT